MTTLEILEKARERISDPEKWCQHDYALSGDRCCAVGAIGLAVGMSRADLNNAWFDKATKPAVRALEIASGDEGVVAFNDTHTHAEVLQLFSAAIEAEKARLAREGA